MTITGTKAANYTLTQPTGLTANITSKALSVISAVATNKEYDGTTAAAITGATLSGVLAGDVANVTLGNQTTGTFAQATVGTGIVVTPATMTITGTKAANYSLTQPTGLTANITSKELTVINALASNKE